MSLRMTEHKFAEILFRASDLRHTVRQQGYEVKDVGRKSNVDIIVCWTIQTDSEFRSRVARSNRLVGTADPLSECMQKLANVCGCFAMWHHESSEILKELALSALPEL